MAFTLRNNVGRALTYTELDTNFTNPSYANFGTATGAAIGDVKMSGNLTVGGTASALSMSGMITGVGSVSTDVNSANDTGSMSIRSSSISTVASISFHRPAAFAINMGVGTDNVFRIGGWSASSNCLQMDSVGNLTMLNNVTAYSDERFKTNWRDLPADYVDQLATIKHGIYDRTDVEATQVGVSAQSLQEILEHAVLTSTDGILSVAYGNAALVSAVELAKRVVELQKIVDSQQAQIDQINATLASLVNK